MLAAQPVTQRSQALALLQRRGMARLAEFNAAGVTSATVSRRPPLAKADADAIPMPPEPVTGDDGVFDACPGVEEATVLVGSANGKTFDRISVWYGPYVAGSYAEGAYELDFPMTAAMLATYPELFAGGAVIAGLLYARLTSRA